MRMSHFEYAFLTDSWKGPKGAAYNATYEFCCLEGWCDQYGNVTNLGNMKCDEFEENNLLTKPF